MAQPEEFSLWLECEHWQCDPNVDPADDFCNMKVTLASGKMYAMNVWTFRFAENAIHSLASGDAAEQMRVLPLDLIPHQAVERSYLLPPDLLVARLDRPLLEEIIRHLLEKWGGKLLDQWECRDFDEDE